MKNYIRILTIITTLMLGAVSEAWAELITNDEIEVKPSASAGTVTVASVDATTRKVILTVTPATTPAPGYFIKASDFVVEKLVNPDKAKAPGLRTPKVTDVITGKLYNSEMTKEISSVEAGSVAKYVFTVPADYDGAYVTATFHLLTEDNIIRITASTNLGNTPSMTAHYILVEDVDASVVEKFYSTTLFSGTFEGEAKADGTFPTISGLSHALFQKINNGTVRNIMLDNVGINITSTDANVGAIANEASGSTRIYNCGILSGSVGGTKYVGGIVGFIKETARVINCFSYANITGGTNAAGIVGYNNVATTMTNLKTMVMNCMFYGNITGATTMRPVYGGQKISNAGATGINGYNYYRNGKDVTFDDNYTNFAAYFCTLPADEEYLTRFEYYRSILNSNKKLCTWWINGTSETAPTDADVEAVGIAKWVLDPEIAPYPILKKWGKYPSVINQDPEYVWNPKTKQKVSRSVAEPYQGKKLGTISVTVNAGVKHAGTGITTTALSSAIVMDMDTLNHDYCYAKIQLPYYNELFGDPTADVATQWDKRYAGNYKDYVVTGWKITSISGGTPGTFKGYAASANGAVSSGDVSPDDTSGNPWEDGFNFADRNCTNKDLYSKSGRVFAQGGYYYVPEGVTAITIEAYWGKAVYLHNKDHSIDRVNVASSSTDGRDGKSGDNDAPAEFGSAFIPAGTLSTTFQGYTVKDNLQDAIAGLTENANYTVCDQAIVLVGNVQVKNRGGSLSTGGTRPFTIMSCDLDFDNEPDYCLQFQQRNTTNRPAIHPVRFDFLPIPELGLAIRTNNYAYAIGLMCPKGHFEITETAFMHTTQFEYDADIIDRVEAPIIFNGGHFEQIVVRFGNKKKVSYFLMGGHFRMKRFTPGYHASNNNNNTIRHCAVNAIGGDYPEFYLSGIYKPDLAVNADNPHCYINGGKFGTLAGAGYEQIDGNVTFKIDHALIENFYGGGLNGAKPVTGNIDVTINNSIVYDAYCGGPKVGAMTKTNGVRKTVTTTANNTIFEKFFGGGNGGTSYYREQKYDNDVAWPKQDSNWTGDTYYFSAFNPLNFSDSKNYNTNKGYHDLFEFEIFNSSNGLNANAVIRTIYVWAQFGTTITGTVTNTLDNCTIKGNFYGGGSLGNVDGDVISTLTNTQVEGAVFGGGYSAEIPQFRVHNKNAVHVPHRNNAGVIDEQGYLEYVKDNGKDRYYRWTNDKNGGDATTDTPTYWSDTDNEYKCYTPISLEGLGEVSGNVTLIINGNTVADEKGKVMTVGESVYGGGEESGVGGNTTVTVNGGSIGVENPGKFGYRWGNVYGGGKGKIDDTTAKLTVSSVDDLNAGQVEGNTTIEINGGTILHNVYGGGAVGSVGTFTRDENGMPYECAANTGLATVTINGGTIGQNHKDTGMVNGSSRGWEGNPKGEGALAFLNQLAWVNNANVIIGSSTSDEEDKGPTIMGSVFGGGENGHNFENGEVTVNKGTVGYDKGTWDCGNIYGAGCGTDTFWRDDNGNGEEDAGEEHHNPMAGLVRGTTTITVNGGHVIRNIYGGGSMGSVGTYTYDENGMPTTCAAETGNTTININGGTIGETTTDYGYVFGGPKGNLSETDFFASVRKTTVNINTGADVKGSVFGGGEAGIVKGGVVVNINGGEVTQDVYGGGALANTNTDNWGTDTWAEGKSPAVNTTTVNLKGGKINRNVYGSGLGQTADADSGLEDVEAKVYGNVLVELNNGVEDDAKGCVVLGSIFGCNNLNGTPMGDVMVHVYKTQNDAATRITNAPASGETPAVEDAKVAGRYDVAAVYGGGNQSAYEPADEENNKTEVVIDGCGSTSIERVYGGGNAACTPATNITVNGTFEILELFGGGNGLDNILINGVEMPNPGANVGYKNYSEYYYEDNTWKVRDKEDADTKEERLISPYVYGTGIASVNIFGGTIHRVFGGSNTKGNVRQTAVTLLDENSGCPFCVDEAYGGGKEAEMDAEGKLLMACIPGLEAVYGGAEAADVKGGVTLNITNGTFGRVFGGNNLSGTISGPIKVNIEEVGCKPIIIGELYGGGNQAAYSVYGYDDDDNPRESGSNPWADPEVNVTSFTSIGEIYGGGYGADGVMVGYPKVSINEAVGTPDTYPTTGDFDENGFKGKTFTIDKGKPTEHTVTCPAHVRGKIGAINKVFGGGNAAQVKGGTQVNIGTTFGDITYEEVGVKVGVTDVTDYYIRSGAGTTESPYTYAAPSEAAGTCDADGKAVDDVTYYRKVEIIGADIRGNVYGGGNNAVVTGSTNVTIGKKN